MLQDKKCLSVRSKCNTNAKIDHGEEGGGGGGWGDVIMSVVCTL